MSDCAVCEGAPSPVSLMDRLQQLIKACQLWNLCNRLVHTGGQGERAVTSRTSISARLFFPSCCSHFFLYRCAFSERETGAKRVDLSQDKSSKPHLCVHPASRSDAHSSNPGFHSQKCCTATLIYKGKCEAIISAATLTASCSRSGYRVWLTVTAGCSHSKF